VIKIWKQCWSISKMRFDNIFKKSQSSIHQDLQIIPYLTLGILNNDQLIDLIGFFIDNGVKAVELGFPFSDAVADGPIIQAATQMALNNHFTPAQGFESIQHIRTTYPELAISLMLYSNSVYAYGLNDFYDKAKNSGIDAILIPDIPNIELKPFIVQAQEFKIQPVLFITPNCQLDDIQFVAKYSRGYIYCITRSGVTGINQKAQFKVVQSIVSTAQEMTDVPIVCGFGIKNYQDLLHAQIAGCQGAIIGSQLIQHLIGSQHNMTQKLSNLKQDFSDNINQILQIIPMT